MTAHIINKCLIPEKTSKEQTLHLNELLGADEQYFPKEFITSLFFKLPFDIIYNNVRGYLSFGPLGIEYTSLNSEHGINVVYATSTIPHKDLCDCLIEILEFFRKYKNKIEIVEAPDDCITG